MAFSLPFVRDECASYIGLNESYPTEIPVFRERFDSCDRPYRSKGLGALFGVCLVATGSTVLLLLLFRFIPGYANLLRAHYGTSGTVRVPNLGQGPTASSM